MKSGIVIAILALSCNVALASEQPFEMEVPSVAEGATPQVIGAVPANPAAWPATLFFRTSAGACTSTVIGSRAILTAAHCVNDGQTGTVKIGGRQTPVKCTHHPGYASNYQLDVALCLAQENVQLPHAAKPETVNFSSQNDPDYGESVTLLGYGCRQQGGGGPAGVLFIGQSNVNNYQGSYIVTRGGAAVCFGDSGGASFSGTPDQRRVFGVNSRGDISTTSYLTNMSDPQIVRFARSWARTHSQRICGLDEEPANCRE